MYLDPGFGGMLIQVLVAIVAAGGAIIFGLRKKIRALFAKKSDAQKQTEPSKLNQENKDDDVIDVLTDVIDVLSDD